MDNARFKFLFHRYIHQICTEDERTEFLLLIESSTHDQELRALMDTLWQGSQEEKLSDGKADELFHKILSETPVIPIGQTSQKRHVAENTIRRFDHLMWGKVAAAVALLILSVFAGVYFFQNEKKSLADVESVPGKIEVAKDMHQFVELPDGSTVVLNAGSTLDFSNSFADNSTREVILTGEGYFDIKHDPLRPFIVHTGKLKTTVLGTAFNIRAYANDNNITVTVTRGKVKVSNEEQEIGIINPDQQITFNGKNNKIEQHDVNSRDAIAWAENDIFFNEITVEDAVSQLEERFKISIEFENEKLKGCRFTATFVQNETLDQILAVICEFNNASYREDGKGKIIISGNGC